MRLFTFLADASEKRPWLVVIIAVLMTVFMAAGAAQITTELSQEAMMPEGYESIEALETVGDVFGGVNYEYALVVADDVTSSQVSEKILDLSLEKLVEGGVEEGTIINIETYLDFFKQQIEQMNLPMPSGMILEAAIDEFLSSPGIGEQLVGNVITEDGTATLVNFQLDPDLSDTEQADVARNLEGFLDEEFSEGGTEVFVSGSASLEKDAQDFMQQETQKLMLAALIFVMLILYLTFRRVSDIFLPLLIIMVAIMWLMGFMGWVGIPYTTMSIAILPLMLGINIAYVIHILSRYYEERESGQNLFAAATTSIKTVGVAVFLTAVTTAIGFSSFVMTDFPPMRDFGIICVLGIVFSFALSLTLLPAVIVLRDRRMKAEKLEAHLEKMRRRRREARYGLIIDKALVGSSIAAYHRYWIVIAGVIVLLVFAGFATFNLKSGADFRNFYPKDMPSREASDMITETFGPQDADVILVEGDIYEPAFLEQLLEMEDKIASDSRNGSVEEGYFFREGIVSIADMIARSNSGEIPASREEVEAIVEGSENQQNQIASMVSEDGKTTMVMVNSSFPETEDETRLKVEILRDHASEVESETELELIPTGMSVLISDLLGNILPTQLKTSGLALLLCLLVLIIVFKSFSYGLVTLVVVLFGIAVEVIMLFVLGWPLDFFTVTISALVIGIGVDFGIHVTHRFREELHEGGKSVEESIKATVLHVGRALVAAAFTTAGVFAILGISQMVPLRRFGWTVATGLVASLIGAVMVLPSLLAVLSRRKETKSASA